MSKSKRKGTGYETEIVRALIAAGIRAERVPQSGLLGGKYSGDVHLFLTNRDFTETQLQGECKIRARMTFLYDWMGKNDILFMRQNNSKTLVTMSLDRFILLALKGCKDVGAA